MVLVTQKIEPQDLANKRIGVYVRVRWSTFDNQSVPVAYTTFRLVYSTKKQEKFFQLFHD